MSVATNLLMFQVATNTGLFAPQTSRRRSGSKFGYPYGTTAGKAIEKEQEHSLGEVVILTLLVLWGVFMGFAVGAALIGNAP